MLVPRVMAEMTFPMQLEKVKGLCSRLTHDLSVFPASDNAEGTGWGVLDNGLQPESPFQSAGLCSCREGPRANERFVAQMSVNSGGVLSSLTFQAQPASGISQKKRRGRGRKHFTYPPTHTHRPAEIPSPSGPWAGPELKTPCPGQGRQGGAPSHPPRLWRGEPGEYRGGWGGIWEGRGGFFPGSPVGIAICSKFGVGSRGETGGFQPAITPDPPNQASPAVSWVGMVRGSVRPERPLCPAARALSCAREQTPEQRAVLGSEAVVNHLDLIMQMRPGPVPGAEVAVPWRSQPGVRTRPGGSWAPDALGEPGWVGTGWTPWAGLPQDSQIGWLLEQGSGGSS